MSEITSESKLTTKEIVEQAIQDYHRSILPFLRNGDDGHNESPLGEMGLFYAVEAPSGWLVADGSIYNIADYPQLADRIEEIEGTKNHYGGDGVTTFAVPDWQGEYFRASGPNAHPNQGNGGAVGEHQDGTQYPLGFLNFGNNNTILLYGTGNANQKFPSNSDGGTVSDDHYYMFESTHNSNAGSIISSMVGVRPTSTSLLCCIKAVPAGINYSLKEQVIGTWMGKDLYQITIQAPVSDKTTIPIANISTLNILNWSGVFVQSPGNNTFKLNTTTDAWIYVERTFNGFYFQSTSEWTGEVYITLQYTKTTD